MAVRDATWADWSWVRELDNEHGTYDRIIWAAWLRDPRVVCKVDPERGTICLVHGAPGPKRVTVVWLLPRDAGLVPLMRVLRAALREAAQKIGAGWELWTFRGDIHDRDGDGDPDSPGKRAARVWRVVFRDQGGASTFELDYRSGIVRCEALTLGEIAAAYEAWTLDA